MQACGIKDIKGEVLVMFLSDKTDGQTLVNTGSYTQHVTEQCPMEVHVMYATEFIPPNLESILLLSHHWQVFVPIIRNSFFFFLKSGS